MIQLRILSQTPDRNSRMTQTSQSATTLEGRFQKDRPFLMLYIMLQQDMQRFLFSLLLFLLKHSPTWVMPIATANIINIAAHPGQYPADGLWWNGIILILFIVQNVPSNAFWQIQTAKVLRNVEVELRSAIVRRLQQLSIAFHDETRSGQLQSKVMRDVESVHAFYFQFVCTVFSCIVSAAFALAYTLAKNWHVALFFLVLVPISVILVHAFRRPLKHVNQVHREAMENTSAQVIEMIEMLPVTRAHGIEQTEVDRMDNLFEKVRHTALRADTINGIFGASSWAAFQLFQTICFIFCGLLAYHGRMPVGDVVLYQGFFIIITGSISAIVGIYPILTRGVEAVRSIGDILECPDIERNEGKQPVSAVKGYFTLEQVAFRYPGHTTPALRDIALDIRAGECVAFVGESGSGKSTLMSLLIGFRRPTEGRIRLDGIDMETLDLRQYRRFLAVVSQQTVLFSGSVRDNITYGSRNIEEDHLREVIRMANCEAFINELPDGLNANLGEHGKKLSGGQRQRISIARALLRDPRIIILDEATSALDSHSEKLVQESIERLIQGRTTLIVAHRFSTIRQAHRVVVLKQGRAVEIGTQEELLALKGEFHRLKRLQT